MSEVFLVDGVAPVPVGHRVEVRVLKEPDAGWFSRRIGADTQPDQPWVKDLDTGVEYGVYWQVSDVTALDGNPGQVFGAHLRTDLEQLRAVTGRVVACRVLTLGSGDGWRVQTRLELDLD